MSSVAKTHCDAWSIAERWCRAQGEGWAPESQLGIGGTAPVFEVRSPSGPRALKIFDHKFSSGKMGEIELRRIQTQLALRDHDCRSLVRVYNGGITEGRLFLLMSRAPGTELTKRLGDVPRSRIRTIVHDIAQACLFLQSRGLCHRDIKAENVFVSDDFGLATLLDISVIRDFHDPVGVGTDHGDQLPVLATARYSPPEYLFRLIDPGPLLWHALNVYQLGALLHDLIVRTPLFQAEYEKSKSNRYRFAWIVATQDPIIDAADVDQDLIFLARRALDKDWQRRSALRIHDFLNNATERQKHAFKVLGLYPDRSEQVKSGIQRNRQRLDEVCAAVDTHLVEFVRRGGVTPSHEIVPDPADDNSRIIKIRWRNTYAGSSTVDILLRCTLRLLTSDDGRQFAMKVTLSQHRGGKTESAEMNLPNITDDQRCSTTVAEQSENAFASLALELTQAYDGSSSSPDRQCRSGG